MADLAAREQKAERARAEARAAGEQVAKMQQKFSSLQEELTRLYQADPESFDHNGQPLKSASEAGQIVKQIGELDDLGDLQARYEHARQIEQRVGGLRGGA
ncbi:MAG TPA: hypothetical protein VIZ61_13065 [Solirubrobacterales bacterium]